MSSKSKNNLARNIRTFWALASLTVVSLLMVAVWQMNSYIHSSSQEADFSKQIATLSAQNDALEVKLSQLNSLSHFDDYISAQKDSFQKVDVASVRYVALPGTQLAQK